MAIVGSTTVKGNCRICGADRCGPDTSHIRPIDIPTEEATMAKDRKPLQVYDVEVNGINTRMKLTEEHAARIGATPVKKRTAANKARTTKKTETKDS